MVNSGGEATMTLEMTEGALSGEVIRIRLDENGGAAVITPDKKEEGETKTG